MKAYQLGLYEKALPAALSWREKFDAARSAGYDFLEISIDETDAKLARLGSSKEISLLTDAEAETGFPVRTMCLSGHRKYPLGSADAGKRARSLEIMRGAVDFACAAGIRLIQLAGYDVYYEPSTEATRAYFAEGLAQAVEMAAAKGVMLAFETMETAFMDTVEKAMAYVDAAASPYLRVYPDCGNLTNAAVLYGGDVAADLRRGRGALAAMHLKETLPGKFREVPYGTGHVDFPAVIRAGYGLGVRMFVTEFWYTGEADVMETVRSVRGFIGRAFEAAGVREGAAG